MFKSRKEVKTPETKEVPVKKESKELATQESHVPATQTAGPAGVDLSEQGFDVNDIVLPRILLMQAQSDLVADGKAQPGDLVNSLTGEVIGNAKNPLEIVPLTCPPKTWVTSEKAPGKGKPQFKKIQSEAQILAEYGKTDPKDVPWEETLQNGMIRLNKRTLNFYVLVRKEIAGGEAFPYMLSFQSTAYNTGKKMATHFMKSGMLKVPPYSRSLKIIVTAVKGDEGNYHSPDLIPGEKLGEDVKEVAEQWMPVVKSAKVKVDSAEKAERESDGSASAGRSQPRGAPVSDDDLPY